MRARPFAVRLDQANADALLEELTGDRDTDLASTEDDDVLDYALAGSEQLAPGLRGLGRADDDEPVSGRDDGVAAGDRHRVAADDAHEP